MLFASPDTTSSSPKEWHSHHASYYQSNNNAASAQPPTEPVAEHTPSMLVDMTLPRPIPAETALRMVRKTVQTLMYLRGQMGSTWEQLDFLLMQENMRQEQESQTQDHPNSHDLYLGTQNHASQDDDEDDFVIPTKSLREFLETGERMFVDLEESVYDQLYSDLRHSTSTPTLTSAATTSTPPTPPQRPRYISLALLFGTTFTTPKEQYMIRIGPLEPRLPSLSSSIPFSIHNNTPRPPPPVTATISADEQARRTREEKKWDRLLIQQLMGIHSTLPTPPPDYNSDLQQQQQHHHQDQTLLGTDPLRHRTRTHLLMKAPTGHVFTGMFPQQQIHLHQDYPTPSSFTGEKEQEMVSATESCWSRGSRTRGSGGGRSKKQVRWPIHHLHIFGPTQGMTPGQDQDHQHANNIDEGDDGGEDEMWYLVGPGIPILSPLL